MYNFYPQKLVQPPGCVPNILLKMKLTAIVLVTAILQVSASTFAQKITLSEKNTPLKKIFEKISDQTTYDFLVSSENLKTAKPVTINVNNAELQPTLDKIFASQPLTYTIQEKMVVIAEKVGLKKSSIIPPDKINVTGRVVDTTGAPLSGATVRIKDSGKATIANADGSFLITASEADYIEVTFLGFQPYTFTAVKDLPFQNIVLRRLQSALSEISIVSTGYQTLPKERATGSFTTVSKQVFNEQVTPDVLSRLEYIANGVSVFRNNSTNTSQLMVRGISTINGPTSPLIVLDNFPYEGDINNLNPNDVESITILKDAAASSIWGTKAGNGVIVITTKKGRYNQPLKIDFSSNVTLGEKPNLNYLTPLSSVDQIAFEKDLFSKGYYDNMFTDPQYPVVSPVVQILANRKNGVITGAQADQQIAALGKNDVRNDFSQYVYQRSVNQQYNLQLSGGSSKLNYLFSSGYDKDIDNLAANYDRLNFRSQASFTPIANLQITAGVLYTNSNNKSGRTAYGYIQQPYQLLADANGNALPVSQTYSQAFKDNAASTGQLLDWNYYPLTDYQHNYKAAITNDVLANFGISYKLAKGLLADIKYQYENQQVNTRTTYDSQSYFARNLSNSFAQVTGTTYTFPVPKGGISDFLNYNLNTNDLRGQLNYNNEWGKHAVSVVAGQEMRQIKGSTNNARNYGVDDYTLATGPVNYSTTFPNFVTKNPAVIPYNNNITQTVNRFVSVYAVGSYAFDSKYIISGSIRRDGSNLFGVETNDKWTPLWSSGLSWEFSKESFYHFDFLPYLKIRATYGFNGNVDPSKSAVTTISYVSTSVFTGSPYAQVRNFANSNLRWEKVGTMNIGIDFRSKNDRISGSIDLYHKKSTDLYATVPVDYTFGLGTSTLTKNVAEMSGNGVDLEINSVNLDGEFKWLTNFNFSYYRDKVTNYYASATNGSDYVTDSRNPYLNNPVWAVYSYPWAGLDAGGNPQGYINGQISKDYTQIRGEGTKVSDLIYNGPRFPVFFGTVGNTVRYKGISLTARIRYNFGNYFRNSALSYSALASSGITNGQAYAQRWQKSGDEQITNVPSLSYPLSSDRDNFYAGSQVLVEKADAIRLQYVTVSYDLNKKQYSWLPFNTAQIFINANNLGILWRANKSGIDPEYTLNYYLMPPSKTVAFGIRANL